MRGSIQAFLAVITCLSALSRTEAKDKSQTTILRDDQYVCVVGKKGGELRFTLNCRRHSDLPTGVSFDVIEPDSEVLGRGMAPLARKENFSYTLRKDGMHVIALRCRGNTYDIQTGQTPAAHLASKARPLHICGGCRRLHFFVPKSVQEFSIYVHAGTPKEGARVTIHDADGKIVHQEEGDYDKATEIKVQVPSGANDRTWSVMFEDPVDEKSVLDDLLVHLSLNVKPFLVEQEGWATLFVKE
ncbi:MAG: hypothetical protein AB1696_00930 [Planctomycetota bacterium]